MNPNAQRIVNEPSPTFVPVVIHAEELGFDRPNRRGSSLETLQIALAFIVGSAMTLVTLLL